MTALSQLIAVATNLIRDEGTRPAIQEGWCRQYPFALPHNTPCVWANSNQEGVALAFSNGTVVCWIHRQDCCEDVWLADVTGDLQDLVGHPILVADERTNSDNPENAESSTWTFLTLRGIGGTVDLRWCGVSNGYYSETPSSETWNAPQDWSLSSHATLAHLVGQQVRP